MAVPQRIVFVLKEQQNVRYSESSYVLSRWFKSSLEASNNVETKVKKNILRALQHEKEEGYTKEMNRYPPGPPVNGLDFSLSTRADTDINAPTPRAWRINKVRILTIHQLSASLRWCTPGVPVNEKYHFKF